MVELDARGLLGPDTTYVHCNMLSDTELDMLAEAGGRASVSPEVEANMGHGPAATARLRSRGIPTGLSADVCTNVGGDLFGAMRVAIALQRGTDHAAALAAGVTLDEVSMTAWDVLAMATVDGARACGLDDRIGTLEVGKQADVLMLSAHAPNLAPMSDPVAAVVHSAGTHNVDSVYVGGRPVKRGGRFVDVDLRSVIADATAAHDYLLGAAGVADQSWFPIHTAGLSSTAVRTPLHNGPVPNGQATAPGSALLRVLSSTNGRKDVAGIWTLAAHATRHLNASTLPRTRPRQCCCGGGKTRLGSQGCELSA